MAGAGRTDAGVHAAGQVARVRLEWRHGPDTLRRALNAILPPDLAVVGAAGTTAGFDPRRDAIERHYRYAILHRPARSPLLRRSAWWVPVPLGVRAMRVAAALFRGRHDFAAFCTAAARARGSVRHLARCVVTMRGPLILLDVSARGFLHRMVRMIAGAVVAAGAGRLAPARIRQALARGERVPVADAAPPQGLCLLAVRYPGERPGRLPDWPVGGCNNSPRGIVSAW